MNSSKEMTCAKCGRKWVPDFKLDCYNIDGLNLCEPCAMPIFMKSNRPEPLENVRAENICKLGKGEETCAFLAMSPELCCAKNSYIDNNIRKRLREGTMGAKGDHCSGPPAFLVSTTK